jgi:hypothetical protein
MNERFEVGEVAIYWRPISTNNHLKEVTIEGNLETRLVYDTVTGTKAWATGYRISFLLNSAGMPPYGPWFAEPCELRKRLPPQDWVRLCRLADRTDEILA